MSSQILFRIRNLTLSQIIAEGWSTISSLYIAALFVNLYVSSASFALSNFSGRTIGIAVLQAVDAAKRTNTYVFSIFVFTILFIILFLMHNIFRKWLDQMPDKTDLQNYKNLVFDISALGLFNIWWGIIHQLKPASNSSHLILTIMLTAYLLLIGRRLFSRSTLIRKFEKHSYFILIALLIPVSTIFVYWVIFRCSFVVTLIDLFAYFVIATILVAAYGLFIKWCLVKDKSPTSLLNTLTLASIPLLLIPISIPLSNELQYTLSNFIFNGKEVASGVFIVLLLVSAILFFLIYRQKSGDRHIPFFIKNVVLPIIVSTVVLYRYYVPKIQYSQFDMFHHGENLITTQQMFQFGAIPFVDIFPTHGLSEAYSQMLYSLFNGYSFVEPWLWNWINTLVGLLLLFFIFQTLLGSVKAILGIIFLPLEIVYSNYYLIASLPVLVCAWAFSSNNTQKCWKKYLVLWIVISLMFLWRIDFGLACMMALFAIYVSVQIHKFINKQFVTNDIVFFAMTGGLVILSAFLLLAGLCTYHAQSLGEVFAQIMKFITYQGPVQSYQYLYKQFSILVPIQYVLIPAISLVCIIKFCQLMTKRDKIHPEQIVLTFMAIFFLIISVRATQRHSLIEHFNPFGFIFLSSLLFLMFRPKSKQFAFGIFLFVLSINLIVMLPSKTIVLADRLQISDFNGKKVGKRLLVSEFFSFQNWKNKERRATIGDKQFKDIVRYLNKYLRPGQTFYEFANYPMLYVAANKKLPAYFIPVIYNTSELIQDIQVKRLKKFWEGDQLPFVIFKSNTWWDSVDSVPNEVRNYRIAEFIYDHYRPFGKVDVFQLWLEKRKPLSSKDAMGQTASLMKFSKDAFKSNDLNVLYAKENAISILAGIHNPNLYQFIDLPSGGFPISRNEKRWFLSLKYRSSVSGKLQVFILTNNMLKYAKEYSTHADIRAVNRPTYVNVPLKLPNGARKIVDIRLDLPNKASFTMEEARLLPSSSLLPESEISQKYDLKNLPYIWGQYDEKKAAYTTRELQKLLTGKKLNVRPKQQIALPMKPNYDRSTGSYLHLRISAREKAQVTMMYKANGEKNSSITFDIIRSGAALDYLVRMSTQWAWVTEPINEVIITTTSPIIIEQIYLRKGD